MNRKNLKNQKEGLSIPPLYWFAENVLCQNIKLNFSLAWQNVYLKSVNILKYMYNRLSIMYRLKIKKKIFEKNIWPNKSERSKHFPRCIKMYLYILWYQQESDVVFFLFFFLGTKKQACQTVKFLLLMEKKAYRHTHIRFLSSLTTTDMDF